MVKQLRFWKKEFGDERRTIIEDENQETVASIQSIEKGPATEVTVAVSNKGWLKTMKGHNLDVSQTRFKDGDGLLTSFESMTDKVTVVISKEGRVFNVDNDVLPNANTTGEPIVKHIKLAEGDSPYKYFSHQDEMQVLFATDAGYGFVCDSSNLITRATKGKECLSLYGARQLPPVLVNGKQKVAMLTKSGKLLVINVSEIKELSKGKGVKLMSLASDDHIVGIVALRDEHPFYIEMAGRKPFKVKKDDIEHYAYPRARKGNFVPVRKAELLGLIEDLPAPI